MKSLTIKNLLLSFFWAIAIPLIFGIAYYFLTSGTTPDTIQQLFIVYLVGWIIMAGIVFIFYCIVAYMLYVLLDLRKNR